jgi:hypothetical protein
VAYAYPHIKYEGRHTTAARVMCEKVHGPPPDESCDAAHSCGMGKQGCMNPRHLRWDTPAGNHADKLIHGTHLRGERNHKNKITEEQARHIRAMKGKVNPAILAKEAGISRAAVYRIHAGQLWAWL